MNRGSRDSRRQTHCSPRHFNEAPIHESGKSPWTGTQRRCAWHFNEAPIHESGKSLHRG